MKLRPLVLIAVLLSSLLAALPSPAQPSDPTSPTAPSSQADLALRLLRKMPVDQNGSLSPVSLQTAFAMVAAGAAPAAREELVQGLLLSPDVSEGTRALLETLSKDGAEVLIANRLWPANGTKLLPDYLKRCESAFGAKPQPLNYGKVEEARRTINAWVGEKTKEKIPELIPPGLLDASTSLVLTNALYFRGSWKTPFPPERTEPTEFRGLEETIEVSMMARTGGMPYYANETFQAVSLDYAESNMSMTLILPTREQSWVDFRQNVLNATALREALGNPDEQTVSLSLPRFQVRGNLPVIPAITRLGVRQIFEAGSLTGISREPMQVSDAVHQAVVEVEESGTVAAAATAIIATRSAAIPRNIVTFDRPFLFVLHDNTSGAILFIGQVVAPTKA